MKKFPRADRILWLGLFVGLIAVAVWFLRSSPSSAPAKESTVAREPAPVTPNEDHIPPNILRRELPKLSTPPGTAGIRDRPGFIAEASTAQRKAAATDPQLLAAASALRDYRIAQRQNPIGTNAEITRVLLGKNPRGTRYLPLDARLSEKNELTDRWDQPLFFHQISGTLMEIRSAGPDHKMWTADDEVSR